MIYRVVLLPKAKSDIVRNARWWAEHHSAEQAACWVNTGEEQIESLQQFPESHAFSPENDHFEIEIRDKLVGLGSRRRYRAVFTIRGSEVFVLTLRAAEQGPLEGDDFSFERDSPPGGAP